MRHTTIIAAAIIGLAGWFQAPLATAQSARDFTFTDEDGHRILRFAGTVGDNLTEEQRYEIVNAEFSSMVHDLILSDLQFDAEAADPAWAEAMAPRLEMHLRDRADAYSEFVTEFTDIFAQCRSSTCRLFLEHENWLEFQDHRQMMNITQAIVDEFLASEPAGFESVFLVTAYGKRPHRPNVKVFLKRAPR